MKSRLWLALIALYLAWGTTYLAIRFALETIPPLFMTGARFLVAGLVLFIWRRLAGDPAPSRKQWRSAAIIGTFLLVGGIGGVTLAEQYIPSGVAALIVAATPLWVVLLNAFRPGGERPTWQTVAGVIVGLSGIFLLVETNTASVHHPGYYLLGIILVLLAGLAWAIGSILSKHADVPQSPLLASGMELLAGSAGSFILGAIMGEGRQLDFGSISLRSLSGLGYLIVIGSLIGFVCYISLLRQAPTSLVMTYAYVNPLVAVLLGSLLAGEPLTPRILLASPLILISVGLSHWKKPQTRSKHAVTLPASASAGDD